MPNIPPLITHTPNVQPLYAASGGVQVSTDNPSTTFGIITAPINLAATTGLTFTYGKTYAMQIEFTIRANTPITANSTDSLVMAVQSGGSFIGRSLIVPLWGISNTIQTLAFTCIFECRSSSIVQLTFATGGYSLVNSYPFVIESIQLAQLN